MHSLPSTLMRTASTAQRKANRHRGALSRPPTCRVDRTPMRFYDCPGDCQTQTRATDSPAAGQGGPVEAIEDLGKVRRVDVDPVIGDRDCQNLVSFKLRRTLPTIYHKTRCP